MSSTASKSKGKTTESDVETKTPEELFGQSVLTILRDALNRNVGNGISREMASGIYSVVAEDSQNLIARIKKERAKLASQEN